MANPTFKIIGAHGCLLIDHTTGAILSEIWGDYLSAHPEFDKDIRPMVFHVTEWENYYHESAVDRGTIDIVDMGYTDKSGEYVPPSSEHRALIKTHNSAIIENGIISHITRPRTLH